jgi:hypothetical protein
MVPMGKPPTAAPYRNRALLDDDRHRSASPRERKAIYWSNTTMRKAEPNRWARPFLKRKSELRITRLTMVKTTSVFANGLRDDREDVGHRKMRAMRC